MKPRSLIDFAFQPALVVAGHAGFDHHAFGHFRPIAHVDRAAGQHQLVEPFGRIEAADHHVEHRAGLGRRRQSSSADNSPCCRPPISTNTLSRCTEITLPLCRDSGSSSATTLLGCRWR